MVDASQEIVNLSVAIATLDRPQDLVDCLSGLLDGQALPQEVIIVDQSESKSAYPVVSAYKESKTSIIYIHQERRGLSASRNVAIRQSSCPYIAFTDDDCVPDQGWVSAIARSFSIMPVPAAVCGKVLPYGPATEDTYSISPRESSFRVDYRKKTIPWLIGTGGNCAIQTEWIRQVGYFDERLGAGSPGKAAEDADFIYRMLCQGANIRYEPDAIIYHKRQDKGKRLSSRWNYGFGIGAFCGLWLRRRDWFMINILAAWHYNLLLEAGKFMVKGSWFEVRQRFQSVLGTIFGFIYGVTRNQA